MKIWLDDQKEERQSWFPAEDGWIHCRWPEEVIELLKTGKVEQLSLDHDLGEEIGYAKPRSGYDVMAWMEEQAKTNPDFVPIESNRLRFHTQNPVGRDNMKRAAREVYKAYWKRIGDPRAEGIDSK